MPVRAGPHHQATSPSLVGRPYTSRSRPARLPAQLRADLRFLFLAEHGEPLQKTSLDSTWQRFIQLSISAGVISAEERFSLHDLKRKGGTDTVGNQAERQDALEVTDAMMKVYDKSVPRVRPSGTD